MAYKTLMLQIFKPSKHKQSIMDYAILNYSKALQYLLEKYEDDLIKLSTSEVQISRSTLLSIIDKKAIKDLNDFNIQPFKDSLKIDFANVAMTFIAQRKRKKSTSYPFVFFDSQHYQAYMQDIISQFDKGLIEKKRFESQCSQIIARQDKLHPLYFGRYATNRDYCLLYDELTDRFYAKLYLMNLVQCVNTKATSGRLSLKYVFPNKPPLLNQTSKKRYLVMPLAFGKSQYIDLKKALATPNILRTARLFKKKNKYYLMVNIKCTTEQSVKTSTTMGVARNSKGGLHYTVCTNNEEILSKKCLDSVPNNHNIFILSKNIVRIALKYKAQVILESGGGKNDKVLLNKSDTATALTTRQYSRLAEILKYKLPEKKLPSPIEVSANSLYCTCPQCGNRTYKNCLSSNIFACVECGFATRAESIGSTNLARRLKKYEQDKVPIYREDTNSGILFYNKHLDFQCILPLDSINYDQMYYQLSLMVHSFDKYEKNIKKYTILKKLRESPSTHDAVRIVYKKAMKSRMP
ncbi:MAG: hypothetical protein WCR27_01540 [Eubacteriales bacterium]